MSIATRVGSALQLFRRQPQVPSVTRNYGFQDWINVYQNNWQQFAGQWPGFQMTYGKDPAEPIGPGFADYVVGGLQSNGVIFSLEQKRIQIFSQVRYQFQGFNNGRPGKLFPKPNLSLVERPWPGGTTSDLNARMLVDADFAGNNFLVAPEGDEAVRLRPDWVEIVLKARMLPLGPDGEMVPVGYKQAGILYYEGGIDYGNKPAVFLPGEYSHFAPMPDPLATYRGMSWLTPVIREIQADTQATKHKLKFFENAATPNVAVSLPKEITAAQFEAFVDVMDAKHKGVDHAYETLYTGGGADVTVIGANMAQLDFKVTQGAGETRLAAAAGIHPVIVGLSEGMQGSSLNAGNYNSAKRSTVDTTFRHLWQNAAGSLEQLVVPPDAISRLWYDARDVPFLHEDQKDIAEIQQLQATAIAGLITIGFKPDAAVAYMQNNDLDALVGQHSGLFSVQLQPPGTGQPSAGGVDPKVAASRSADWDDDPIGELDEESAALLVALGEFEELSRARTFDPLKHPRNPKGTPGGGRFRSMVDRLKDALLEHRKNGGKGDPFKGFDREQLRRVAKTRGIPLKRGEDRDSIAKKLLDDLSGGEHKAKPERPTPAALPPDQADEQRVRDAYDKLAIRPGDWVDLADIRDHLTGMSRKEQDDVLKRLARQPGVRVIPIADTKNIRQRERDAALRIGIEDNHAISIEPVKDTAAERRWTQAATGEHALEAAPMSMLRPKDLSGDEATALFHYKGTGYRGINGALRRSEGKIPDTPDNGFARQATREIDGIMARSPLKSDVVVLRGIDDGRAVFGDAWKQPLTGAAWTEHAYVSTTAESSVADEFLAITPTAGATLSIRVPKGTHAVEMSKIDYEGELLLERGLKMKVLSDTGPGPRRVIEVEVQP